MSEPTTAVEESAQTKPTPEPKPPGTVVVTGASSGIGRAVAEQLLLKDAHVVIVARDQQRGEEAASALATATDKTAPELMLCDLSVQSNVRALAAKILQAHPQIDALINNAGVKVATREVTGDGLELMLAVNTVAPQLLTTLLQPALEKSSGRVVNVSSGSHARVAVDWDDLNAEKAWDGNAQYGRSKLLSLMLTYKWARQLANDKMTINAYNPGWVRTKMISGPGKLVAPLLAKSPKMAATTEVFLAISPRVDGVSGGYYRATGSQGRSSEASLDEAQQERAWTEVEKLIRG